VFHCFAEPFAKPGSDRTSATSDTSPASTATFPAAAVTRGPAAKASVIVTTAI
jgi:hypothetical protein